MDISGEYIIPAPRATVWDAINDPEVLKDCIPGCDELTPVDAGEGGGFEARVTAKVGPVKASFRGAVRLEDIVKPDSYTIVGEGKGGTAGFAKGSARVRLEEAEGGGTRLTYNVDAEVGGKLAQLGSRLIQGTARKYADDFFACLTARLTPEGAVAPEAEVGAPAATLPTGIPKWVFYLAAATLLILIISFLLR